MQVVAGAPQHLQLNYDGTRVGIRSIDCATLVWLAEFLAPSFSVEERCNEDFSIDFAVDQAAYAQLLRGLKPAACQPAECFSHDGHFANHPACVDSAGTRWVHSGPVIFALTKAGLHVELTAESDSDFSRLGLMRVVRELTTIRQLTRGRLLLHAAAFESSGEATLVCGPKNAGKSTLLINELNSGRGFIANDRTFVDFGDAQPVARGMPTILQVRPKSLEFFPSLASRFAASGYHRARTIAECCAAEVATILMINPEVRLPGLSGLQLCDLLGARLFPSAPITKVLFPRVEPHQNGMSFFRLQVDDAALRLADSALAPCRPWRWPSVFAAVATAAPPSEELIFDQCRRLAQSADCFQCTLGADAYRADTHPLPVVRRAA